jgi:hypothetical protein
MSKLTYYKIIRNDEFKRMAYVYFKDEIDAETVLKYANLRYVNNKQMFIKYATNYLDISDFRTRIEFDIKLDNPILEIKYLNRQIRQILSNNMNNNKRITHQENVDYLNMKIRKIEYSLGIFDQNIKQIDTDNNIDNKNNININYIKKLI